MTNQIRHLLFISYKKLDGNSISQTTSKELNFAFPISNHRGPFPMEYKRRCRADPIPQPFPVLLILALVAIFLFIKRFLSSFELLVVEAPVVSLGWLLFSATPVALLLLVCCLSSLQQKRFRKCYCRNYYCYC